MRHQRFLELSEGVTTILIIIEGPDGGGKSTLATRVADRLTLTRPGDNVVVYHKGPPGAHPLVEYESPLFSYRAGTGQHVICDRWHWGEWVYPTVMGRSSEADSPTFEHVEMFLHSRGAYVVFAHPQLETVERVVRERGDDYVKVNQLLEIWRGYISVRQRSTLPSTHYSFDVDLTGAVDVVDQIIARAARLETEAAALADIITYVGPTRPTALLLGDVRHVLRHTVDVRSPESTREYGPAFGPHRGTSGHYLLTALPSPLAAGIGIANACDVDNLETMWHTLGCPRAVALGNRAATRARRVVSASVPHPQFVRRFHNSASAEYGALISHALHVDGNFIGWRPGGHAESPTFEKSGAR